MPIRMVTYIRRMRGGSSPHMMCAEDGHPYVVKLLGNPQGNGVLLNELLASQLGKMMGLPVPEVREVVLDPHIFEDAPYLSERNRRSQLHVAIRVPVTFLTGQVFDVISRAARLRNPQAIYGACLFDAWTGNVDRRQFVFWKTCRQHLYSVLLIDNGYCFGGPHWKLGLQRLDPIQYAAVMPELKFLLGVADKVWWRDILVPKAMSLQEIAKIRENLRFWTGKLAQIENEQIETAVRQAPSEWGASELDLGSLTQDLIRRKEALVSWAKEGTDAAASRFGRVLQQLRFASGNGDCGSGTRYRRQDSSSSPKALACSGGL